MLKNLSAMALGLLIAAGCAPSGALEASEDVASDDEALAFATITFDAAWNENVSGVLVEGGTLALSYDDSRLASCKTFQGGTPRYAITAHARFADGTEKTTVVSGLMAASAPTLEIGVPGEVQIWFEATNVYGCHEFDSSFGENYRFNVLEDAQKPNWVGNAAFVVARSTCSGGPCDYDRRNLEAGVPYDTWARQRAAIRSIYVDVWEPGVTDRDNPDLWKQIDAQVHYRWSGEETFQTAYVDFSKRVGNDARYELALRPFDPMTGNVITDPETQCPQGDVTLDPSGFYARTTLELYFTFNGKELRPSGGGTYKVTFEDYKERYAPCL